MTEWVVNVLLSFFYFSSVVAATTTVAANYLSTTKKPTAKQWAFYHYKLFAEYRIFKINKKIQR